MATVDEDTTAYKEDGTIKHLPQIRSQGLQGNQKMQVSKTNLCSGLH